MRNGKEREGSRPSKTREGWCVLGLVAQHQQEILLLHLSVNSCIFFPE